MEPVVGITCVLECVTVCCIF